MGSKGKALPTGSRPANNSVILGTDLRNFNEYSVNIVCDLSSSGGVYQM